ncbi:adenylosuccinate lyase [Polaribacter sp. BAL334]|uniref:adenylosuccinate lyase n=1 Tax=Polaribacter sp. BAL334 TaxID=1708178 RepID=UPI0018D25C9D|nr:adenylosuccinate lyase [Polaribacter sp. BAL334]MBG7613328.1 adenylosuccinate lyase [Polaribacter sp. BAL334]
MSNLYLLNLLENEVNASIINRQKVANIVLKDENLHRELIKITFYVTEEISIKAVWVLEWICTHYTIDIVLKNIDEFTENIKFVKFDSAARACSKICELLAVNFDTKKVLCLDNNHILKITETCFDWLISDQKTAVKAYAMTTLFIFGKKQKWIHESLKHLIETKIIFESKGTKARGKNVLLAIEKHRKSRS